MPYHDFQFVAGEQESVVGDADNALECKFLLGLGVLSEPDEAERTLREQFDLLDVSALDEVALCHTRNVLR